MGEDWKGGWGGKEWQMKGSRKGVREGVGGGASRERGERRRGEREREG